MIKHACDIIEMSSDSLSNFISIELLKKKKEAFWKLNKHLNLKKIKK